MFPAPFACNTPGGSVSTVHEDLVPFVEQHVDWHRHLGIRVEEVRTGYARLRLPFREEFAGNKSRGALHGGVISTLTDICGNVALWTHFGPNDMVSTVDMRVDFLRPAPFADLIAEAEVRLQGYRIGNIFVRIASESAPGVAVAEGRIVCYVKRAE
uniref:Thioesterase superfamily protein n=1 Tax=Nitratidesulfovibrio vulgaris (strain DSM 19637 / Miyazaki F) TaxID=883 RepID=B8DP70_NITV9